MTDRKPLLMIVEDDVEAARLNARLLRRRGYEVLVANSASEAYALVKEHTPDLFILDIILPDGDGLSLCAEFRKKSDAPILFLTGKKSTDDRIAGLSGGGDYYLTKPHDPEELMVVVQRLLERAQQAHQKLLEASSITCGQLMLSITERKALVNGLDAGLSPKEFAVLLLMVQNRGVELASESIYEQVWNAPMHGNTGALRVLITRLKKKLDEENTDDFSIVSSHGKGYMFVSE